MSVDFSKMNLSELIRFAEEQAEKERENSVIDANPDHAASWAATLEVLKAMRERGVPESLVDQD